MSRIFTICRICRILRASVSVSLPVGKARQILTVSIPFKRDGVSEREGPRVDVPEKGPDEVSIPFKRDGVSEHAAT